VILTRTRLLKALLMLLIVLMSVGCDQATKLLARNGLSRRDGRVSDFIIMGIGPVRTGVFNLADLLVLVGCLLLLAGPLKSTREA